MQKSPGRLRLMRERVRVECAWLLALAQGPAAPVLAPLPQPARSWLEAPQPIERLALIPNRLPRQVLPNALFQLFEPGHIGGDEDQCVLVIAGT